MNTRSAGIPQTLWNLSEQNGGDPIVLAHLALQMQPTLFAGSSQPRAHREMRVGASRMSENFERIRAGELGTRRHGTIEAWASVLLMPACPEKIASVETRALLDTAFVQGCRDAKPSEFKTRNGQWLDIAQNWLAALEQKRVVLPILAGPFWMPWPPTVPAVMEFDRAHLESFRSPTVVRDSEGIAVEPIFYSISVAPAEFARSVGLVPR